MQTLQQFLAVSLIGFVAAQDQIAFPNSQNPVVEVSSCQALSCEPPNGSICALGETLWPEVGVGMAANAVNTSAGNLSLTLINRYGANGFTGFIYKGYKYSDQSLFVGVDPGLQEEDYPTSCALMIQYQGQTFPLQWSSTKNKAKTKDSNSNSNARDKSFQNTTSCTGVLDVSCQSAIIEIIRNFRDDLNNTLNSTSEPDSSDRCSRLTQHVNNQLRGNEYTCGQSSWIANLMNVTGGSLPDGNANTASDERLGSDQCRPVQPQSDWNLYRMADMRLFYFVNTPDDESTTEFYSPIFGGRGGFTPVMTILYPDDGRNEKENSTNADPEVQFTCMKTFQRDGEPRQEPFGSGAYAGPRSASLSFSLTLIALVSVALGL